jgi:hypothetical protein
LMLEMRQDLLVQPAWRKEFAGILEAFMKEECK